MNKKLAKILAGTTLIIMDASLSTTFREPEAKAFQTSSNIKQSQVTQVANSARKAQIKMTYYSYHDNTYEGNKKPNYDIAYPSSLYQNASDKKGGDGSYETPIIVAVSKKYENTLSPGTRMYAPHLQKYLIVQDQCETEVCQKSGLLIDVWMYSTPQNDTNKVKECHKQWTDKGFDKPWDVEVNPSPGKPIDTKPFFNSDTNECRTPNFS